MAEQIRGLQRFVRPFLKHFVVRGTALPAPCGHRGCAVPTGAGWGPRFSCGLLRGPGVAASDQVPPPFCHQPSCLGIFHLHFGHGF